MLFAISLPSAQSPCISVSNLHKYYGSVHAVDGISFNVEYGKVFGFLGPNGAGKTTTIRVLTTLIHPSQGSVEIFGKDIVKHSKEIKKRIGVVFQEPSFEANLTVERALELYGFLWGLDGEKRKAKVRQTLDKFDLGDFKNVRNNDLSLGQRRRLQVAREFMHDMDLVFLDEPTVGLDPSARRLMLNFIKKEVAGGLTVFFTTHIMEEAEYLCDEIAIINKGKIIASDTPKGLKQRYGGLKTVEIKLKEVPPGNIRSMIDSVSTNSIHVDIQDSNTVRIASEEAEEILVRVIELFAKNKMHIENVSVNPPSLEDVFLNIVKEE